MMLAQTCLTEITEKKRSKNKNKARRAPKTEKEMEFAAEQAVKLEWAHRPENAGRTGFPICSLFGFESCLHCIVDPLHRNSTFEGNPKWDFSVNF